MKTLVAALIHCTLLASALGQQSIVDQFERRSLTLDGFTLPYRLFVPANYDPAQSYPLVLALHGAGERGTDNERHIVPHRLATSWADPVNQDQNPAFVVAPQVPPGGRWTADLPVGESDFNREELTTLAILDSLAAEFNLDADRIYITGLSMGGHGTWDLISRLPHRFAAAVPMSGNADSTQANKLLHLPIWSFHGESDTVVRPFGARGLIQGLENLGRNVIYTDCRRSPVGRVNFDCPGTISEDSLANAIGSRADLIMTNLPNGGHGPWNVWYDHPQLAGWLFSKRRVDPDAITIDAPQKGDSWSGVNEITWTSAAVPTDLVEVWISLDNGRTWVVVDSATVGDGSYALDTDAFPDAGVARVRLVVIDNAGRVYARRDSPPFTMDNAGDAAPFLDVDDEDLRFEPNVTASELRLALLAADPEGATLVASIFYSIDGGSTFALAQSADIPTSVDRQSINVDLDPLPNSANARIRVDMSDGTNTASRLTATFVKQTPRFISDYFEHVTGDGTGSLRLHFVEQASLTNHRYRITFDTSNPASKTYDVLDVDLASTVLSDVPLSDGILESPIFDGMSLVVEDLQVGGPNLEATGWTVGDTNLGVSIVGGTVFIAILQIQLLETETDYEITIASEVADTSLSMFAIPSEELRFVVTGRTDGERRKLLFRDASKDGLPGNGDVLYILEPDADSDLAPAWELRFSAGNDTILPDPGDTFLFVPLRKLGADDVFEFVATVGVNVDASPRLDLDVDLISFPNPFHKATTISYRVTTHSSALLEVYDVLGRRLLVIDDAPGEVGRHHVHWDGADGRGVQLASGLHVLRLTLRTADGVERRYQQPVVKVR